MKLHGLAAALLLTGSALGLAACNNMGYDQPSQAQSGRAQADRQAIAHVQSELQQVGLYNGPIDGAWGPESRSAMANFQQSKGLPPSGQPDQPSLNALASAAASGATAATNAYPPPNAPPPPPASASRPIPSIAQVQQELQQLGYYQGRVDGRWGRQTRAAMATFQRSQGLPATGQGDMRSMNRLADVAQSSTTGASGYAPPPGASGTSYPPPPPASR
jgi:peptidoglycan hydrolase-like protein with peptidoglycan-binding domain